MTNLEFRQSDKIYKEPFDYVEIDGKVVGLYNRIHDLWFSAGEVGQKLIDWSFGKVDEMIAKISPADKYGLQRPNGTKWFVSENGLFYLLMNSDKPNTDAYKDLFIDIIKERRRLIGQSAKEFWEEVNTRVKRIRGIVPYNDEKLGVRPIHPWQIPVMYGYGQPIVVQYRNGKLHSISTRGNGRVGDDITEIAKDISEIPKEIQAPGQVCAIGDLVSTCATKDVLEFLRMSRTYENFHFYVTLLMTDEDHAVELGFTEVPQRVWDEMYDEGPVEPKGVE